MDPQHSLASHSSKEAPTRPLVMRRTRLQKKSRRALLYWYGPRTVSPISTRLSLHTDTRPRACYRAAPRRCPRRSGPPVRLWAAVLFSGGGTRRAARADRPAPVPVVVVFLVVEAVRASSSESCAAAGRASNSHKAARAAGSRVEACTRQRSAVLLGHPSDRLPRAHGWRVVCVPAALVVRLAPEPARTAVYTLRCGPAPPSRRSAKVGRRSHLERDLPTGSGEP